MPAVAPHEARVEAGGGAVEARAGAFKGAGVQIDMVERAVGEGDEALGQGAEGVERVRDDVGRLVAVLS